MIKIKKQSNIISYCLEIKTVVYAFIVSNKKQSWPKLHVTSLGCNLFTVTTYWLGYSECNIHFSQWHASHKMFNFMLKQISWVPILRITLSYAAALNIVDLGLSKIKLTFVHANCIYGEPLSTKTVKLCHFDFML